MDDLRTKDLLTSQNWTSARIRRISLSCTAGSQTGMHIHRILNMPILQQNGISANKRLLHCSGLDFYPAADLATIIDVKKKIRLSFAAFASRL